MSEAGGAYERISVEDAESVRLVTLNRPDKRNALDDRTVAELTTAIAAAETTEAVRVVLLRGAGKDFCAGADLAQLQRLAAGAPALENLQDAERLGALFVLMRRLEKPVVAAVRGHAIAGGAGLANAADMVVASEDAVFGYPEVHIGFVPAMVMAMLRRSVGEKVAFDLVANGGRFSAQEAHRIGLVTRVLPDAGFEAAALDVARQLARRSASALRLTKRLLYGMDGLSFEEAIARGAEVNVIARSTEDSKEGVRRFLEKKAD